MGTQGSKEVWGRQSVDYRVFGVWMDVYKALLQHLDPWSGAQERAAGRGTCSSGGAEAPSGVSSWERSRMETGT